MRAAVPPQRDPTALGVLKGQVRKSRTIAVISLLFHFVSYFVLYFLYERNAVLQQYELCLFSHSRVATENLDLEDGVIVVVESNGHVGEDQMDNHRPSETNNNPSLVCFSPLLLTLALR